MRHVLGLEVEGSNLTAAGSYPFKPSWVLSIFYEKEMESERKGDGNREEMESRDLIRSINFMRLVHLTIIVTLIS